MFRRRAAVLLVGIASYALSAPPPRFDEDAADGVAAEILAASPSAGLVLAAERDGRTLFARGYGFANVTDRVAASGETVFPICSISKNFAAAAILKLAEQGRIDRSAPASRYLAGVPGLSPEITVDALLNHSSGLGSYNEGDDWDRLAPRAVPRDEMVARIASRPHSRPGEEWGYSNSAFYLAGLLVERVSGRSYWDFLGEAFFRPLGMRRAGPCAEMAPPSRARGYRVAKGSLAGAETENWRNPYAGGGLCMTAGELLAWQEALDSGRALSPESVRAMRAPTRLSNGRRYDYGLGTRLGSLEGHPVLGHTGGGQGFSNVLMRFPDDDLTIVVLKNYAAGPGSGRDRGAPRAAVDGTAGVRAETRHAASGAPLGSVRRLDERRGRVPADLARAAAAGRDPGRAHSGEPVDGRHDVRGGRGADRPLRGREGAVRPGLAVRRRPLRVGDRPAQAVTY